MTSDWRYPKERAELVERLVASEKRCRILERQVRALEDPTGDHGVTQLVHRVAELEDIVERLNQKLRRQAS